MPKSTEAQGVTVDEAIQNALNSLGLGRDSVEIEIIHHPRSGFLGIGARRAKVRATMREQVMRDGEEFDMAPDGARGGRRRRRSGRRRVQRGGDSKPREQKQRQAASQGSASGSAVPNTGGGEKTKADEPTSVEGRSAGPRQPRRGSRRGRKKSTRSGDSPQAAKGAGETPAGQVSQQQGGRREPARPDRERSEALGSRKPDNEARQRRAVELTERLLSAMGVEGTVTTSAHEGELAISIACGDGDELLVGRRGTTLDAVEHLINRMTMATESGARLRITVDVAGYRGRRKQALAALALKLKDHAIVAGRKVQVTPLNPQDRDVFLAALASDDAVKTRTPGLGFYRKVVIIPRGLENDSRLADEFDEDGFPTSSDKGEPGENGSAAALGRDPESIGKGAESGAEIEGEAKDPDPTQGDQ